MTEKIKLEIDLDDEFDGIDLEVAINQVSGLAKYILVILYNKWVSGIKHPEMVKSIPNKLGG